MSEKTQSLIRDIERKDRRWRLSQSLFMILSILAMAGVIFLQYRTLEGVQNQLEQQKQATAEATERSQQQREVIIRRLDCITVFFSQRDRTNLSISDIDKCSLDKNNPQQFFSQPSATGGLQNTSQPETTQPVSQPAPSSQPQPAATPAPGPTVTPSPTPSLLDRVLEPIKRIL